jgi:ubiquinone/menaquinone biosynthesis C-methylase UbiE
MMTWEETIEYIRTNAEYQTLIRDAYFDSDLAKNVENYKSGEEFKETLKLVQSYAPDARTILDIGCGNGISSISFALKGYQITAVEPDPSNTIGAGAIRILKEKYQLDNIEIHESLAEDINFPSESFDIVYIRQAMHHANDLTKFIGECGRVLKKGGLLITIRDHVIYNAKDKEWFLEEHPLHKFYGGENAFTSLEYKKAMQEASLKIQLELKYYDSVINYFPLTKNEYETRAQNAEDLLKSHLSKKIGFLSKIPFIFTLYKRQSGFIIEKFNDERLIPGRMYSYIAIKHE